MTAIYGLDHAESLEVVLSSVWKYNLKLKTKKILQYGQRIFGISGKDTEKTVTEIIDATEKFFRKLGMKTKLAEYGIKAKDAAEKISSRFKSRRTLLGEKEQLTPEDVKKILLNC